MTFLWTSVFDLEDGQPAFVAPVAENDGLLILYDADYNYRLVRVDPTEPFNKFADDSYLNYIVQSSPWKIEEGTSHDWEEVHSYLRTVPQRTFNQQAVTTVDLGFGRFHYQREELLSGVKQGEQMLSEVKREADDAKQSHVH